MTRMLQRLILLAILTNSITRGLYLDRRPRIVKGQEAGMRERPYQVSIQYDYGTSGWHYCGGSFINGSSTSRKNWVLTAAHCIKDRDPNALRIVEGAWDLEDSSNSVFKIQRTIMHDYNPISKQGDLALILLEDHPKMGPELRSYSRAQPVDLVDESFESVGKDCMVSGWGLLEYNGQLRPQKLREVALRVVSPEGCEKMLKITGMPWDKDQNTMICAGGRDKDACQGDSGGPLVCEEDGKKQQVGIISWGYGCATLGVPGVYTNLKIYKSWIASTIERVEAELARSIPGDSLSTTHGQSPPPAKSFTTTPTSP